ncbi:hypothetical protein [Flavobacterium anhuiense]|uniref:hypothetical protein n=1 Tax=Flavobacterium anhuiense TaxID=459526 RepID=UPI0020270457|nr:hypothetical protein [Flavobacterium anhuiense]URM35223.1 hypothetical protein LLY39_12245 [Flavobacterium anhuiense]
MRRITNYLTGAFLLFLLLSCTNDGNDNAGKTDSLNPLKEELHLEKFSNVNIAKNVEVNWNNALQTEKKNIAIVEFDAKEKFPSKIQSSFLKAEMNYQLISIESEGELKNYFIEVFSYNDSEAYSKTITKLDKFKGVFNVFSLNGQNLGTIAIDHGNARNISESKALDFLAETINSLYVSSGITKKIPLCDGTYTQVVEQAQDRWRVVSSNGKILSVEYMDTVVTRTTTILPYPCDGSGDRDAIILQRTAHYYTGDGKSYAGVSGLLDVIITDPSFSNNPCLVAVFTKLGGSPTFQTYLKKFDSKFSVANLKLSVSSTLANNVNAETTSPINYLINIEFNENNLKRPALSIAKTFMHEMIHAEMYRKLLSVAGQPQIQFNANQLNQLRNDYPGLYDYYMRYEFNILPGQNPSDAQHEAMAVHYRDIIVQTLKQFDNSLANETYEALAWEGLKNTIAWKKLPVEKQNNISSIITNFNNQNSNCQ